MEIKILIIRLLINEKEDLLEMENKAIAKQIVDFHKATFDNTFNSLTILQKQADNMIESLLLQAAWIPAEGKDAIKEWMNIYSKGCTDFKNAADKNYEKVEKYFAAGEPSVKTKKAKTK
jgi:hypothetical protein